MAVTVHPHHTVSLHGITRIAALGAALTASAAIGFVSVNALTGDGDPNPMPPVAADSSAAVPSVLDWPAVVDIAAAFPFPATQEQRAFLDQFAADTGHDATATSRVLTVPAMPFDPGLAQGVTHLIPDADH